MTSAQQQIFHLAICHTCDNYLPATPTYGLWMCHYYVCDCWKAFNSKSGCRSI